MTTQQLMKEYYADVWAEGDETIRKNNLVRVTSDDARRVLEHHPDTNLWIRCHCCGKVSIYSGYPAVPDTSMVMCMRCGNTQVGGEKYMQISVVQETSETAYEQQS